MMLLLLILAVWAASGVLAFGATFAYMQGEWLTTAAQNRRDDYGFAAFIALLGPFGLLATTFNTGFWKHGWRLR